MIGSSPAVEILVDRWDDSQVDPDFDPAVGTNVFRGRMPDDGEDTYDELIMVMDVPSRMPEHTFGETVAVGRPRVQVYVRAKGQVRCEELAKQAWYALTSENRTTAEGTVLRTEPTTHPHPADRDERDRILFVFTVELWMTA